MRSHIDILQIIVASLKYTYFSTIRASSLAAFSLKANSSLKDFSFDRLCDVRKKTRIFNRICFWRLEVFYMILEIDPSIVVQSIDHH